MRVAKIEFFSVVSDKIQDFAHWQSIIYLAPKGWIDCQWFTSFRM